MAEGTVWASTLTNTMVPYSLYRTIPQHDIGNHLGLNIRARWAQVSGVLFLSDLFGMIGGTSVAPYPGARVH